MCSTTFAGGASERAIVKEHDVLVAGKLDIYFHHRRTCFDS